MKAVPINHTIKCGIKSKIPICCVLFFTFIWDGNYHKLDWYDKISKKSCKNNYQWMYKLQYVRCPICTIRHRIVKIKECKLSECKRCI